VSNKKKYTIKMLNGKPIVILLGYDRVEYYLPEITNELNDKSYSGELIFDLLLSNGFNKRFFSAIFFNKKVNLKSFTRQQSIDPQVRKISAEVFSQQEDLLDKPFLPPNIIDRIRKELSIIT
jgi:hypothetical protein